MAKDCVMSATRMLMSFMAMSAFALQATAQEHRIEHWLEVDNKIVRPGESVRITWWCKLTPGPGEPFIYQGHPAKVLYLNRFVVDMLMTTSVDGEAWLGVVNYGFDENEWTTAIGNNIYDIDAKNDISLGTPTTDNPIWGYKYIWKPKVYENAAASVTMNPKYMTLALEVPALGKYFPFPAIFTTTQHRVEPAEFMISDKPCLADCNDDLELNIDDFICFATNFALGDITNGTDCDENYKIDINDFICFQTNFVLGC